MGTTQVKGSEELLEVYILYKTLGLKNPSIHGHTAVAKNRSEIKLRPNRYEPTSMQFAMNVQRQRVAMMAQRF
ncbi:unnamed protein product [Rotaria sp. Silwood1]|nr:unnamed protein product [Rotaria sp. Silwood1]CAF4827815.1 unnamed protein product [Rotaria sp. Silwood1]CAF4843396.1 unnamed protein product [Rotaria sp. Silwood1]